VHLDEAEVARRVALQRGSLASRQAGLRIASRIVMPSASFWSSQAGRSGRQRAGAEEGGLVALAFLLGEADHLDAEGQRASPRELAHAGHRREDAQPAVVLAAVAHGVVVRAGEQRFALGRAPSVAARPRCRPRRSSTSSKPHSRIVCAICARRRGARR
jgi:hypothetical protein